jgi:hypothetical protein
MAQPLDVDATGVLQRVGQHSQAGRVESAVRQPGKTTSCVACAMCGWRATDEPVRLPPGINGSCFR